MNSTVVVAAPLILLPAFSTTAAGCSKIDPFVAVLAECPVEDMTDPPTYIISKAATIMAISQLFQSILFLIDM